MLVRRRKTTHRPLNTFHLRRLVPRTGKDHQERRHRLFTAHGEHCREPALPGTRTHAPDRLLPRCAITLRTESAIVRPGSVGGVPDTGTKVSPSTLLRPLVWRARPATLGLPMTCTSWIALAWLRASSIEPGVTGRGPRAASARLPPATAPWCRQSPSARSHPGCTWAGNR